MTDPHPGRLRVVTAVVLVVVCAVAAVGALVARWVDAVVTDTDAYVAVVAPLADDEAIQDALTAQITDEIVSRLRLGDLARSSRSGLLGGDGRGGVADEVLDAVGSSIAGSVESAVESAVRDVVTSPQFSTAWNRANREAHASVAALVTQSGRGPVDVDSGEVSIRLAPFVDAVRARLDERGFLLTRLIPDTDARVVLFQIDNLPRIQRVWRIVHAAAGVLPWVALAAGVGGIALARRRVRAIGVGAVLLAAVALAAWLVLRVTGSAFVNSNQGLTTAARAAVENAALAGLRSDLMVMVVAAGVVGLAAGAWSLAANRRSPS